MTTDSAAPPLQNRAAGRRAAVAAPLLLSALVTGLAALLCLRFGLRPVGFGDLWAAFVAPDPGNAEQIVLRDIRLPRLVAALVTGASLGMAGALMQALSRNPLADPGLLGVNAGAALGVVASTVILRMSDPADFIWSALGGALAASAMVFSLAGARPTGAGRLLLAGAAVSALFFALIRAILLLSQSSLEVYRQWVLGGFAGLDFGRTLSLLPFFASGAALAFVAGFGLNALQLGDSTARALGLRVGLWQLLCGAAIVLLCAACVALAGPIAFVGLIVPHVARLMAPSDIRWLVLFSALHGATLMCLADLVGRLSILGGEMQAGVMAAILGGPVLIWFVRRTAAKGGLRA